MLFMQFSVVTSNTHEHTQRLHSGCSSVVTSRTLTLFLEASSKNRDLVVSVAVAVIPPRRVFALPQAVAQPPVDFPLLGSVAIRRRGHVTIVILRRNMSELVSNGQ